VSATTVLAVDDQPQNLRLLDAVLSPRGYRVLTASSGERALAEDREHALAAVKTFEQAYGAKFPKATAKITDDAEELLAFYDYPAEQSSRRRGTHPPWASSRRMTWPG
jgi:CheY-like chemotaxis protein